ncbi:MAG TPA: sigma-70 family RNA polymerase sigma factor, partial [Solirubrobacteraceae bacterium]|nr:sigma-70 family RNA polymerase sigma factor [Solirubrobacteraceae bacterium]
MSPWLSDLVLRSQSDERLVSLARAGHDRAFVVIVERYERRLLAFATHLGAGGRAEDVVQQAFLSAFAALRAEREVSHLSGWLHQIVRNGVAGVRVAPAASAELEPETSSGANLEDHVASRIEARSLLAELARLPERQRDALVLTSLQGRSRSEVAVSLGTTEGAVRQMVHRARTSLRNAAGAILPVPVVAAAARSSRGAQLGGATATTLGGGVALKAGAIIAAGGLVAAGLTISHHPPRTSHGAVLRAGKVERHPTFSASLPDLAAAGRWPGAGLGAPAAGQRGANSRIGASGARPLLGVTRSGNSGQSAVGTQPGSGEAAPSGSEHQSGKDTSGSGAGSHESGSSGSGTSGSSGGSGQDGAGDPTGTAAGSSDSTSTAPSST